MNSKQLSIQQAKAVLELRRRKDEYSKCESDIVYFINNYCKTYDPRLLSKGKPPIIDFVLFEKQVEYIHWLQERISTQTSGLVEKSRDAGVTWLNAAFALHGLLFTSGCSAGFGSRKLDLVDKLGDMDSIFEKIRFMYKRLPVWLQTNKYNDAYCRITNGEQSITGEGGDQIGRGGRKTVYFVDEAAFIERYDMVEAALSQNTETVIEVSTHNGVGTRFFQKRNSGTVAVFVFDWTDDPRKDIDWYNRKKQELPAYIIAQEIDRNPYASLSNNVIDMKWVLAATKIKLQKGTVKECGLDVADGGVDKSCYISREGAVVSRIVEWDTGNVILTANKAINYATEDDISVLKFDSIGVGAGCSGTFELRKHELKFKTQGINGAESPSKNSFDDVPKVKNNERFVNKRAELWWALRRRFEKTYQHVEGIKKYPEDELIQIPNDTVLQNELCMPLVKVTESGKIKIESKEEMKRRGVKSPNRADALVYCFAPQTKNTLYV